MLKQSSKSFRALLAVVFAALLSATALAQGQSPASTQPPAQSPAQTKKGSASVSCDGALDIVPTKAMSFVRKRRPNKGDAKPQAPANSKPQPKPSSGSN